MEGEKTIHQAGFLHIYDSRCTPCTQHTMNEEHTHHRCDSCTDRHRGEASKPRTAPASSQSSTSHRQWSSWALALWSALERATTVQDGDMRCDRRMRAARERQNSNTAEQKAQKAQQALPGSNVLASAPSAVDLFCLGCAAPLLPSQHAFYASLGSELLSRPSLDTLLPPLSVGCCPPAVPCTPLICGMQQKRQAMTPKGPAPEGTRGPWRVPSSTSPFRAQRQAIN